MIWCLSSSCVQFCLFFFTFWNVDHGHTTVWVHTSNSIFQIPWLWSKFCVYQETVHFLHWPEFRFLSFFFYSLLFISSFWSSQGILLHLSENKVFICWKQYIFFIDHNSDFCPFFFILFVVYVLIALKFNRLVEAYVCCEACYFQAILSLCASFLYHFA